MRPSWRVCAAMLSVLCGAAIILPACGRRTAVKPPELVAPAVISNLTATNATDGIVLSWPRPTTYTDGTHMRDLGAFRVERRTAGMPFAAIGTIAVTDRERFQQERRFRWLDTATALGETYDYRVVSETTDGYVSQPSNVATVERAIPTPAPAATPTRRA